MLVVKTHLENFIKEREDILQREKMILPDITLDPDRIQLIMISETVPSCPEDYFYSRKANAEYMQTTIPILRDSGLEVRTIDDIVNCGIYITTAIKTPKDGYTVPTEVIKNQLPILEEEIKLFDNIKIIMLMGDVAKKAMNLLSRKQTKKNVIPSGATYKLRSNEYYYGTVRVLPSYIITGGNILIEKSKVRMIKEDLILAQKIISIEGKTDESILY